MEFIDDKDINNIYLYLHQYKLKISDMIISRLLELNLEINTINKLYLTIPIFMDYIKIECNDDLIDTKHEESICFLPFYIESKNETFENWFFEFINLKFYYKNLNLIVFINDEIQINFLSELLTFIKNNSEINFETDLIKKTIKISNII